MSKLWSSLVVLALTAASHPAFAQPCTFDCNGYVPEPGVLELAGIGLVAAIAVGLAKKRRK